MNRNSSWQTASRSCCKIHSCCTCSPFPTTSCPFVVVPYETRILGPTVYGTLGAATAIMVYFQLVIDFGFLLSGTQEVARSRDDRAEVSRIFTATTLAKLLLIVISLAALVVLCQVIPAWRERQGLYLLFFCGTAINSLSFRIIFIAVWKRCPQLPSVPSASKPFSLWALWRL